jgi:hypothetical protein
VQIKKRDVNNKCDENGKQKENNEQYSENLEKYKTIINMNRR